MGGGRSRYRIVAFSGMFMMWISGWLPGLCCCGRQLLREDDLVTVLIFMKCFSDAFSSPSVQSGEPGLVPAKPHPICHCGAFIAHTTITVLHLKINEFIST